MEGTISYYVKKVDFHNLIIGQVTVILTPKVRKTVTTISAIAFAVPVFILGVQVLFDKLFEATPEIIGLSMALLVGGRVWVINDVYIMQRWLKMHNHILIINGTVFIIWFWIWGTDMWAVHWLRGLFV